MSRVVSQRAPYQKASPVHDEKARKKWAKGKTHCIVCGISRSAGPRRDAGVPLQTHHLIRASGRSDEPCAMSFVCGRCHDLIHDGQLRGPDGQMLPKLSLGMMLTAKRTREPEEFDASRLAELFGQSLPDLLPIPEFLEREYRRNRPSPYRPTGDVFADSVRTEKPASPAPKPAKTFADRHTKAVKTSGDKRCPRCIRLNLTDLRRGCGNCARLNGKSDE